MSRNEKEEDDALMTSILMLTCCWLTERLEEDAGKDEKEKNDNYPL